MSFTGLSPAQSWPVADHQDACMPAVLVVEDELLIREFIKEELEAAGYVVIEARR